MPAPINRPELPQTPEITKAAGINRGMTGIAARSPSFSRFRFAGAAMLPGYVVKHFRTAAVTCSRSEGFRP
jgi:hypothetical protein